MDNIQLWLTVGYHLGQCCLVDLVVSRLSRANGCSRVVTTSLKLLVTKGRD